MFQTQFNHFEPIKVFKDKKSITVPDMSFTPREIIQKFSRGERVPLGFEGLYDDDNASPFEDDPTRDPNFDFGDYVEEKYALEQRQKVATQRSSAKASPDSQRKARREELSASDAMSGETTSVEAGSSAKTTAKE